MTTCNKKVSVIIPCYNVKPEYIKEAINSVLNQTYKNFEIIIVNDGSTNKETLEYLNTINNEKIKIINQNNKGAGGARNTGIENATGDYLGFLDADDWLDNNFYETLVNLCEENNADIACGVLTRVSQKKKYSMDNFKNVIVNNFSKKIKFITNGSVSSKIFKKNLFKDIRFIENIYWEDNLVLLQLLINSSNVAFTNKVKYLYRENINSTCLNTDSEKVQKRIDDGLFVLEQLCNIIRNENIKNKNAVLKIFLPILFKYQSNEEYNLKLKNILGDMYDKYLLCTTSNSFLENIFSMKNSLNKYYKIITILGLKFKIKRNKQKCFQ